MQPIAAEARRRLLAHLANDEGLAPKTPTGGHAQLPAPFAC